MDCNVCKERHTKSLVSLGLKKHEAEIVANSKIKKFSIDTSTGNMTFEYQLHSSTDGN